ncbi:hypothetical protein Q8G35_27465 [Peribacillus simplex]|uniref:Uncharacterized protein n=2 Tax=Peribacillus TaxID=2675229 RepID=A0AA90P966_9BACI|nr:MULTISPECIES: hypothetical protein [Peribacillus]MDP1421993.1 hypothetical protein [Peribacillus simplex]MDP1454666.1 hypothetical protein [Peribacillus frigoritolerans]
MQKSVIALLVRIAKRTFRKYETFLKIAVLQRLNFVSKLHLLSLKELRPMIPGSSQAVKGISETSDYVTPFTAFGPWIAILIMAFIVGCLYLGFKRRSKK